MKFSKDFEAQVVKARPTEPAEIEKRIAEFKMQISKEVDLDYELDKDEVLALTKLPNAEIPEKVKEWMVKRFEQLLRDTPAVETKAESKEAAITPIDDPTTITPDELRVLAALPCSNLEELLVTVKGPTIKGLTPLDAREYYLLATHPNSQWVRSFVGGVLYSFPPVPNIINPPKVKGLLTKLLGKEAKENESAYSTLNWEQIRPLYLTEHFPLGHLFSSVKVKLANISFSKLPDISKTQHDAIISRIKNQTAKQSRAGLSHYMRRWFDVHSTKIYDLVKKSAVTPKKASALTQAEKDAARYYLFVTNCARVKFDNFQEYIIPTYDQYQTPEFRSIPGDEDHMVLTRRHRETCKEYIVAKYPVQSILANAQAWMDLTAWEKTIAEQFAGEITYCPPVQQKTPKKLEECKIEPSEKHQPLVEYFVDKYYHFKWYRKGDRFGERLLCPRFVSSTQYFTRITTCIAEDDINRDSEMIDILKLMYDNFEDMRNHRYRVFVSYCGFDYRGENFINLEELEYISDPTLPSPRSFTEILAECKGFDLSQLPEHDPDGAQLLKRANVFLERINRGCFEDAELSKIFKQYQVDKLLFQVIYPGYSIGKVYDPGQGALSKTELTFHREGKAVNIKVPVEFASFLVKAHEEFKLRKALAILDELQRSEVVKEETLSAEIKEAAKPKAAEIKEAPKQKTQSQVSAECVTAFGSPLSGQKKDDRTPDPQSAEEQEKENIYRLFYL